MTAGTRGTVTIGGGGRLEVAGYGDGETVVVIQTALTADELLPFTELLAQDASVRSIHVGRRGYGTISSPGKARRKSGPS